MSQALTVVAAERLEGQPATVGLWTRADSPTMVRVALGASVGWVPADGRWTFRRVVVRPPKLQRYGERGDGPLPRSVSFGVNAPRPASVDGVVLASGTHPETPPRFLTGRTEVDWGGVRTANFVANGSAEDGVVSLPGWLPNTVRRSAEPAVDSMYSLLRHNDRIFDASSMIRSRLGGTFGIFWGTAGWDQPPRLFSPVLLWVLGAITGVGLVAAALASPAAVGSMWRGRSGVIAVAAVAMAVVAVVVRGIPPTDTELLSGRYLFPGLLPVAVCLVAGWRSLVTVDDMRFRRWTRTFAVSTQATFILTVFLPFRLG